MPSFTELIHDLDTARAGPHKRDTTPSQTVQRFVNDGGSLTIPELRSLLDGTCGVGAFRFRSDKADLIVIAASGLTADTQQTELEGLMEELGAALLDPQRDQALRAFVGRSDKPTASAPSAFDDVRRSKRCVAPAPVAAAGAAATEPESELASLTPRVSESVLAGDEESPGAGRSFGGADSLPEDVFAAAEYPQDVLAWQTIDPASVDNFRVRRCPDYVRVPCIILCTLMLDPPELRPHVDAHAYWVLTTRELLIVRGRVKHIPLENITEVSEHCQGGTMGEFANIFVNTLELGEKEREAEEEDRRNAGKHEEDTKHYYEMLFSGAKAEQTLSGLSRDFDLRGKILAQCDVVKNAASAPDAIVAEQPQLTSLKPAAMEPPGSGPGFGGADSLPEDVAAAADLNPQDVLAWQTTANVDVLAKSMYSQVAMDFFLHTSLLGWPCVIAGMGCVCADSREEYERAKHTYWVLTERELLIVATSHGAWFCPLPVIACFMFPFKCFGNEVIKRIPLEELPSIITDHVGARRFKSARMVVTEHWNLPPLIGFSQDFDLRRRIFFQRDVVKYSACGPVVAAPRDDVESADTT